MILRHCICIPTYNNPLTIEQTVKISLELTQYPIVIVDDGSDIPVMDLFRDPYVLQAKKSGRLSILRHEKNRGKGSALQTAFVDLVSKGYTHMIALDGDGQHLPSEIQKLVTVSVQFPWDIIIGNRKLTGQSVPEISKFGRNFSNFWVGFQTDIKVSDSQCGFRIYPLFQVQNFKFWTTGFDFEIEVLIRLLWNGVQAREVEIEVHYPPAEERVSHFDKFWDNVRISVLNTFLVIISLLKTHRSPSSAALAVGLGVAVGCTPFFGFHTLIVAALSFLLRLNAVYLWLGSQVSIPIIAPFLVMASVYIGKALKIGGVKSIVGFSANWLVGSLILGTVLGLVAGGITYFTVRRSKAKKKSAQSWSGKTRGGTFGNWFLKTLTRNFGLGPAYACLYFIIPYFYLFAPKARRSCNEYWKILDPQKNFFQRQWLILTQLFTFAQILLDRVYQSFSTTPRFVTNPNGIQNIIEPVSSKKGLIVMTAHVGGWDLSSALLRADGLSGDFQTVQFESHGLTFNKVKGKDSTSHLKPLHTNNESQPILSIRQWLSEGKPVGLMGDRPLGNQFELVPFFDKLAPIDITPFRIAAACRTPLLFSFGFKGPKKTYDFFATEPKFYSFSSETSKALQCYQWAQEYAKTLEGFVRRYPKQWANFYPFWSTVPASPGNIPGAPQPESSKQLQHTREGLKSEWALDSKPSDEEVSL